MKAVLNLFKNKKTRAWSIAVVVILVGTLGWTMFGSSNTSADAASAEAFVVSLNVAETVETSGSLEAQPFASLAWKTGGVVEQVNVQVGDFVKEGDILAELQPSSTSASIVAAQADLVNAQKKLDDLLKSGTDLAQAAIDLKDAQEAYDDAVYYLRYLNNDTKIPQTLYTAELVQTRNGWEYKYETDNFKGPAPEDWIIEAENDLALKKAQMEDAQREYERLLAGETSLDVKAAQAEVEAAQTSVNSLYILAPFDGEVLSVDDLAGDTVNSGELSVNLADLDHLYVDTQVDESDVAKVKLGNQAQATLDAMPGVTLTGKVAAINPVGEVVSGLVKYKVRIDLDKVEGDMFLPLGTTTNVVIQVGDSAATLAVPITAIQNDSIGEYVWVIQSDGSTARVDIVSGSIVGDLVAVSGDLKEGERVQSIRENSFSAPGPFGGGD
ncbi:MAG: efflux RND transporter periplasmic adaptor subunit [Chloroflexi bacterium]|nr:efflux RND transporter periplasmic adaptor subunit [Chloroflexota bacterium]